MAAVDPKVGSVEGVMKHLLAALDPIQPAAITVFAGRLDPSRMSFIDRTMTALMKVRTGDFRDWNAIAAWVRTLPALLNR
jgi:menaquinone-dependent protoporphyrinogen oxidase